MHGKVISLHIPEKELKIMKVQIVRKTRRDLLSLSWDKIAKTNIEIYDNYPVFMNYKHIALIQLV